MGRGNAVELVFIALNHNVSLAGKIWLMVMVLLRGLTLLLTGFPLYEDERESFACNTIQPGCSTACYDAFAPLSLLRFWLLQVLALCLPYALYVVFVIHRVVSGLTSASNTPGEDGETRSFRVNREIFQKVMPENGAALVAGGRRCRALTLAYTIHVSTRIALEAAFGVGHYFLFGLSIPKSFLCHEGPCTSMVECYVSKPTEKTVMLNFMLAVSALCLLVTAADLICAIRWLVSLQRGAETVASSDSMEEGASLCLEELHISPISHSLPSLANSDIQQDIHVLEEDGAERDSSTVRLCSRNRVEPPPLQRACSPHLRSPLPLKLTRQPPGGADSSGLLHGNRLDDLKSENSEKPGRRAWV
ncbi:gap junction delta-4 protein-like [Brienomyrus brachyistius]|uniref:gap junction delta-4 protein-like n=1 Tax=Brienomyrus brachyistius TaxID=42636 RepID=UPI0020B35F8F|nr:gap junction delta-4 protein-like [Brienomyrus brachyistius]